MLQKSDSFISRIKVNFSKHLHCEQMQQPVMMVAQSRHHVRVPQQQHEQQ